MAAQSAESHTPLFSRQALATFDAKIGTLHSGRILARAAHYIRPGNPKIFDVNQSMEGA